MDDRREAESARAWINVEKPSIGFGDADADTALPTPTIALTPTTEQPYLHYTKSGFDDDFTEFVSAPAAGPSRSPTMDSIMDRLVPMYTGASYHSLASVSDIDVEQSWVHHALESGDEDEDPELPSQAEIAETSRQIFDVSGALPTPDNASASTSASAPEHFDEDHAFDHPDADEDDFEMAPFDLSRVLHALQGMKEQIAGIEDGPEKRRAAARVALGLAYGLQVDKDDEAR